jgi:Tfp pilus assembly protein PilP
MRLKSIYSILLISTLLVMSCVFCYAQKIKQPVYDSTGLRDPFFPPSHKQVEEVAPVSHYTPKTYVRKKSDGKLYLKNLKLSGIIQFFEEKQAVLLDTANNKTYTLKGGKLYNTKREEMQGFNGEIVDEEVIVYDAKKEKRVFKIHK